MHIAVRNTMLADTSVSNLLGQRIRWGHALEGDTYPLAVLQKVSEHRFVTLDGDSGLARHLVQIDVYAHEHRDMRRAGEAVCRLWSGYRSLEVSGAFVQNIRETIEAQNGADGPLYRASLDILIIMKEQSDE